MENEYISTLMLIDYTYTLTSNVYMENKGNRIRSNRYKETEICCASFFFNTNLITGTFDNIYSDVNLLELLLL